MFKFVWLIPLVVLDMVNLFIHVCNSLIMVGYCYCLFYYLIMVMAYSCIFVILFVTNFCDPLMHPCCKSWSNTNASKDKQLHQRAEIYFMLMKI